MENFIIIGIALVVVLIILRFVFRAAKGIITLAIAIVLLGVGLHYFSPETVDKLIGAERHARWTQIATDEVNNKVDEAGKKLKKKLDEVEKVK